MENVCGMDTHTLIHYECISIKNTAIDGFGRWFRLIEITCDADHIPQCFMVSVHLLDYKHSVTKTRSPVKWPRFARFSKNLQRHVEMNLDKSEAAVAMTRYSTQAKNIIVTALCRKWNSILRHRFSVQITFFWKCCTLSKNRQEKEDKNDAKAQKPFWTANVPAAHAISMPKCTLFLTCVKRTVGGYRGRKRLESCSGSRVACCYSLHRQKAEITTSPTRGAFSIVSVTSQRHSCRIIPSYERSECKPTHMCASIGYDSIRLSANHSKEHPVYLTALSGKWIAALGKRLSEKMSAILLWRENGRERRVFSFVHMFVYLPLCCWCVLSCATRYGWY